MNNKQLTPKTHFSPIYSYYVPVFNTFKTPVKIHANRLVKVISGFWVKSLCGNQQNSKTKPLLCFIFPLQIAEMFGVFTPVSVDAITALS